MWEAGSDAATSAGFNRNQTLNQTLNQTFDRRLETASSFHVSPHVVGKGWPVFNSRRSESASRLQSISNGDDEFCRLPDKLDQSLNFVATKYSSRVKLGQGVKKSAPERKK